MFLTSIISPVTENVDGDPFVTELKYGSLTVASLPRGSSFDRLGNPAVIAIC
jgi:hypothetical protein